MSLFARRERGLQSVPDQSGAIASPPPPPANVARSRDEIAGLIDRAATAATGVELLGIRLDFWQKNRPPGELFTLLRSWPWMDADARSMAWSIGQRWWGDLLAQAQQGDPVDQAGFATLIADRILVEHIPALARLLLSEHDVVRSSAEQGLIDLTREPNLTSDQRLAILRVLAEAVEQHDKHRRTTLVQAFCRSVAMWACEWAILRSELAWLADDGHPAVLVLRSQMRKATDPVVAASAWRFITQRALRTSAAQRVLTPLPGDSATWLMSRAFLIHNSIRRAALAEAPAARAAGEPFNPSAEVIDGLDVPARIGSVHLAVGAPSSLRQRDQLLAGRLLDSAVVVRRAAVRCGAELALPPSCLGDYVFDPDARVARAAVAAVLAGRGGCSTAETHRLALTLLRSPHAAVRDIARAAMTRAAMALGAAARAVTARLLTGDDTADAARIVEVMRTGHATRYAAELTSFITSALRDGATAPRTLSAAASALGQLPSKDVEPLLRQLLASPEPRVRASAVESMIRRARRDAAPANIPAGVLIEALGDEHHRVRANAARGLMQLSATARQPQLAQHANRALLAMIRDARPLHQRAALWATAHIATTAADLHELLDAAEQAKHSADEQVATAAAQTSQRLMDEFRRRWSVKAPSVQNARAAV